MQITTNAIARERGTQTERQRTNYAITAQIAEIQDRINNSKNDTIRQAWTVAIIELTELQRTINGSTL